MKHIVIVLIGMLASASTMHSQMPSSSLPSIAIPPTTAVLVIESPREGVTYQQVMAVIPLEIRATVKLYLDGRIREWYSRGDGKGVIFLVDAKSVDDARKLMETLPFAQQKLMDAEYIPVGPLMPLRALMSPTAQQQSSSGQ
jgi:hypothetical protein